MAVVEAQAKAKATIAATKLQAIQRGNARKQSLMLKKGAALKIESLINKALFSEAAAGDTDGTSGAV